MSELSPETVVWIGREVLEELFVRAESKAPLETGGVLMGYWGSQSETVVTQLIGPGPNATHKEDSFIPDQAYHEQEIARIYEESGRTEVYLGDWHSHIQSSLELGEKDHQTLEDIARHKRSRLDQPLMAIVGVEQEKLVVWRYVRSPFWRWSTGSARPCEIRSF